MRTTYTLSSFLVALVLTGLPSMASADREAPYAWPGPGHMGYGMGTMMGPGMMGGYGMMGMDPGMLAYGHLGPIGMLDLKDEQIKQISKIQDDLVKKHRDLMQKVWEQQDQLSKLYYAEKRDEAAIKKAYAKLNDLQKEMLDSRLDADKRIDALLSKEQKEQMQRGYRRWGMMYR